MGSWYRIKTGLVFSSKEQRHLLLTALVMTMSLFFYLWAKYPNEHINISGTPISLVSMIYGFVITYAILLLMIGSAKAIALVKKYTATYKAWFNGLLIGFVVTFASYGYLPVVFPGIITLDRIESLRRDKRLPGVNKKGIFWTLSFSLITVVIMAILFQQIYLATGNILFEAGKDIASLILIYSVLPFPNNYGSHMFYTKKKMYFVFAFFSIIFALSILLNSPYAIIIGIGGGALLWLVFNKFLGKEFF
ncbi:MAG: hypothetical protein ACQESC_00760 [Nanobdellota archaeon]